MAALAHVAIDGPAGSGKTTVARALARAVDLLYLDTGAMYRAVALATLRAGIDPADEAAVVRLATGAPVRVVRDLAATHGFRVWSGDVEFGEELYGNDVSTVVSTVAAYPRIRAALVERQRAIAEAAAVIMAGRDIGTVVLPDAPHKIFLTASLDARVERRAAELVERGVAVVPSDLRRELVERDRLDATRAVAPLRPAPDAIEIDSTGATVDAVVARIAAIVRPDLAAR